MQVTIAPDESGTLWAKRAYAQLNYAFMLRATVDWNMWGFGWDVIESAPAEVVPALPVEPNWLALPYWVKWWAINGDGTIRAFHLKPMGWVERRIWMLGAHGPVQPGLPIEMIAGQLGEPVPDWWMTLRRRPAHMQPPVPPEVEKKPKKKRKRKEKEKPTQ